MFVTKLCKLHKSGFEILKQKIIFWIEDYLFFPNSFQKILSYLLLPFSFLYIFIIFIKRVTSSKVDFGIPIISIGNLTVGGSGKTPITIELAKNIKDVCVILREKEEMESSIMAKAEIALNEKLKLEKEKIQKATDEQNELKLRQKDEQLRQLQEQLQIAQRKAEQGSMQLQGEVQELAIEEWLKEKYPFDTIDEVKKGARGADCMQIVHTRESQNCGKIYYESKRTKDFQKSWIEKFKADMREKGADIGVLVTDVMPSDMQRIGLYEGIWICSFEEFKGISAVLREQIIKIHHAMKSQENKTDKMSLLYGFLTSNEFKMQIEAIVEAFTTMQSDLDSEKRSMQRIWKQREKQIEKVLDNTINMYGSIRGIAGNAIGNIKALELGYSGDVIDGDGNEEL